MHLLTITNTNLRRQTPNLTVNALLGMNVPLSYRNVPHFCIVHKTVSH